MPAVIVSQVGEGRKGGRERGSTKHLGILLDKRASGIYGLSE